MKYNIVNLTLKTDKNLLSNASKVRGYIGNQFKEYDLLHNHVNQDNYIFNYPLVQYKIINDYILIQGIDEGGEILKIISDSLNSLNLEKEYKITEKIIHEKEVDIKPSSDEKHYEFITPWLGLNQVNYKKYSALNGWKDKKDLLNRILVGNILSMSKSLGIIVNKRLYAKTHFEMKQVKYKSLIMNAFVGVFKIYYDIPDYFGLGKGVSHGFGCVKQIKDEE